VTGSRDPEQYLGFHSKKAKAENFMKPTERDRPVKSSAARDTNDITRPARGSRAFEMFGAMKRLLNGSVHEK